ncbi:MAG TPA: SusC/RagA family TonB-linked outer membrane protein [Niabella sp.]
MCKIVLSSVLLLLLFSAAVGQAQVANPTGTINGIVTSLSDNSNLRGVTITASHPGGKIAARTLSDSTGRFELTHLMVDSVYLVDLEHIGFKKFSKSILVKSGHVNSLFVQLTPVQDSMPEVVVIGYGQVKGKDLTGSVTNVNTDVLQNTSVMSADLALQGRVAGMDILASSGEPGAEASIRIRGTRSVTATNEPLIVVDGVYDAISSLTDINMADIASISVLKDASAAAIYGSRGSNGVIIITTKKGLKGRPNITLKTDMGISQLPRLLDVMDASEFAQYRNDYAYFATSDNYGLIGPNTPQSAYPYPDPLSMGTGTNWVKEITRNAGYGNYLLTLSGGGGKANYYASFNYNNTQGIIQKSGAQRYTGRLNLDYQLFKWMKVGYGYNYTNRNDRKNVVTIGGTNWWNAAVFLNPLLKVNSDFNDLWYSGQKFNSPRAMLDLDVQNWEKRNMATHSLNLDITPARNFKWNTQFTYYQYALHAFRYEPGDLPAKAENEGGTAYRGENTNENLMLQSTLTYTKDWAKKHHIDAMAGFTGQKTKANYFSLQGKGYLSDDITWNNMGAIPDKENLTPASSNILTQSMSYFSRFNYNYKSRYYATVTARQDGASNFAANKKWAFFPSAALKWRVSSEKFMKNVSWVDELSIRLSAGRAGNSGIDAYRSLSALTSTTTGYLFDGGQPVAFYPLRLANNNLSWEKTDMYNIATDISLFNKRVSITLEGYLSYTSDLLLDVQTPTQTGYTTQLSNVGKTNNRGFELTVSSTNINRPSFLWSSVFTLSHNRQRVDDIGNYSYVNVYGAYGNNSYMMYGYKVGYPLNALWGFQYAGTWKSADEINRNKVTNAYVSASNAQYTPGSARYIDVNHDGIFNEQDLTYLGNADPDIYGGIQNDFRIRNFFISTFFSYSLGGKIYNVAEQWLGNGSPYTNQYRYMLDAWHPVRNPQSDIPRAGSNDGIASDRMVHDASFFRLKNLAVGYTLNTAKLTRNAVRDIQLVLSGDNLVVWKYYNGFDPDVSSSGGSSTLRRVDIGAYPKPRTYTFSIQARF